MVQTQPPVVGPGTIGTKALSSKYPVTEGLIAVTTKRSSDSASLEAEVDLVREFS